MLLGKSSARARRRARDASFLPEHEATALDEAFGDRVKGLLRWRVPGNDVEGWTESAELCRVGNRPDRPLQVEREHQLRRFDGNSQRPVRLYSPRDLAQRGPAIFARRVIKLTDSH